MGYLQAQRLRNTTFKLLLTFAVCLLTSHDALARRGYVRTRQGSVLEGHMRFESNAVVVVDASREVWAEVALTNIAALGFESAAEQAVEPKPETSGPLPVPWESEDVGSVREPGGSEYAREGVRGESIFDQVEEGASLRKAWVPQIELKSGSSQAGYIERMDDTAIWFDAAQRRPPVSTHGVALVRFQPVPLKLAAFLATGRKGVLLGTGEFIEGECGGIANHRVTISSVPLGLKRFDVNNEVIAVVLGKRAVLPRRNFEVTTTDGATWLALDVALDRQGLVLREPYLGTRRFFMHEIAEVRRGS